jgi:hypothetical protein
VASFVVGGDNARQPTRRAFPANPHFRQIRIEVEMIEFDACLIQVLDEKATEK